MFEGEHLVSVVIALHRLCGFRHREPRFLALQKLLHHDNKKRFSNFLLFVDLRRILNRLGRVRNARSDRLSLITKLKQDIRKSRQIEEKETRVETKKRWWKHWMITDNSGDRKS